MIENLGFVQAQDTQNHFLLMLIPAQSIRGNKKVIFGLHKCPGREFEDAARLIRHLFNTEKPFFQESPF